MPPAAPRSTDSMRNCVAMWCRMAPRARRSPISIRRSSTPMTMTEDADDGVPVAAEPDARRAGQVGDVQGLRGGVTQHGRRVDAGGLVEEGPVGELTVQGGQQGGVGGADVEAAVAVGLDAVRSVRVQAAAGVAFGCPIAHLGVMTPWPVRCMVAASWCGWRRVRRPRCRSQLGGFYIPSEGAHRGARAEEPPMPEPQTLLTGLAMGESPRWHEDRLWLSDMGANEVVTVDLEGTSEVVASVPAMPTGIGWLPDGRLLIVSARDGRLLRREPDGSLVTHADLSGLADHPWSEIVVDGRDNVYVNNIGFDFPGGEFAPGILAVVAPDGSDRQVADGVS